MAVFRSSGDLIADRRFDYALAAREAGDLEAAVDILRQVLVLVPGWSAGWFTLGEIERARGEDLPAAAAFREALRLDPEDSQGALLHLARLGAAPQGDAMRAAYVAALFDDYAPRFDTALVDRLGYRGPALIMAALDAVRPMFRAVRALDLGCGTGLMAEPLRSRVDHLSGVDLSSGMIGQARRRGLYDHLAVGEVLAVLQASPPGRYDLIVAADVFVYMADLAPVITAAARTLAAGGLLAFSVQAADAGWHLGDDMRYAHGRDHLEMAAQAAGLALVACDHASTRQDRGQAVPGMIAVLERS